VIDLAEERFTITDEFETVSLDLLQRLHAEGKRIGRSVAVASEMEQLQLRIDAARAVDNRIASLLHKTTADSSLLHKTIDPTAPTQDASLAADDAFVPIDAGDEQLDVNVDEANELLEEVAKLGTIVLQEKKVERLQQAVERWDCLLQVRRVLAKVEETSKGLEELLKDEEDREQQEGGQQQEGEEEQEGGGASNTAAEGGVEGVVDQFQEARQAILASRPASSSAQELQQQMVALGMAGERGGN
jgi:hypothetical protein